ncbi:protein amalgam isoform X7 [Procambarus clarkii]|uniref:protein amalgam isoform X7 n=1 Tax=Procambarus clarkii TaxID=6728 RepID=UPI0037440498
MMESRLTLLLLAALLATGVYGSSTGRIAGEAAHAQSDDGVYEYDEYDNSNTNDYNEPDDYPELDVSPTFITNAQQFSVELGGDITFPCAVENLGSHLVMFKHIMNSGENKLLFVGDIALKPSVKFTKNGNSFVLNGVARRHAGKYVCRIETSPATELTHTLDVQYPATVRRVSPEVQRVVQGSSVTLECVAEGNPPAAINWSRQQGHLPSGAQSEEGLSITLENVDRHVEGTYICTASNGIGDPSSASMTVEVEYPPEVITEQAILHTGEGDEAKLMCIVHGRPPPHVSWGKDGKPINPDYHITEHDSLHRHTLTISKVREEDFGDYTCTAENSQGQKANTLRLTGLPKTPKMTSSPSGGEKTSYTLTWETESYTPIAQYRLQYRKFKPNITKQAPGMWIDRLHSPKPSEGNLTGPIHHMSHAIEMLEPATDYEATVAVENKFGWSGTSDVFQFCTRKEVAFGQSANGCGTNTLNMALLTLVLSAFLS